MRLPSNGKRLDVEALELLRRPDVEAPLLAFGVGVQRAVEAALGTAHLAQRPVQRALRHLAHALLAGDLPAVQVGAREQRVVVEHLLEVGDAPGGVDAVAVEAAADLVVDAAGGHVAQRLQRHRRARRAEQELDRAGGGELRRRRPSRRGRGS